MPGTTVLPVRGWRGADLPRAAKAISTCQVHARTIKGVQSSPTPDSPESPTWCVVTTCYTAHSLPSMSAAILDPFSMGQVGRAPPTHPRVTDTLN